MISKGIDTFARINRDIVAGIWQTALIMPLDCAMFIYFTGEPSYPNLDYRFWIFFSIYTIFFIGGYAVAPIIRKRKLISMLTNFVNEGKITQMQKQKIWNIVKDNAKYSPLWSKDGFLSFIMENIYCISIIFAFFGGEGLINACLNGTEKAMSIIHLCLAVSCLLLESRLDKYLAKKVRKKYQMNNMKIFYGVNKDITTRLIADITGDSTSNNLMNLHLESMLEDITDILDVSNDKQMALINALMTSIFPKVKVLQMPAWDTVPYDRVAPAAEIIGRQIDTLIQLLNPPKKCLVLTTVAAWGQLLPPKEFFKDSALSIHQGQSVAFDVIQNFLNKK